MRRPHGTCLGLDTEIIKKFQEGIVETNNRADPFSHCCQHIVDDYFLTDSIEVDECFQQPLLQIFLSLAVREIDIEHAAVPFNHGKGIELSAIGAIGKTGEMSPVDL